MQKTELKGIDRRLAREEARLRARLTAGSTTGRTSSSPHDTNAFARSPPTCIPGGEVAHLTCEPAAASAGVPWATSVPSGLRPRERAPSTRPPAPFHVREDRWHATCGCPFARGRAPSGPVCARPSGTSAIRGVPGDLPDAHGGVERPRRRSLWLGGLLRLHLLGRGRARRGRSRVAVTESNLASQRASRCWRRSPERQIQRRISHLVLTSRPA